MAIVPEERSRLNSWKEIANFLGVSVRAAQRWEEERGLPVHRLPGARGPVYAEIDQLREWQRQKNSNAYSGWSEAAPGGLAGRANGGKEEGESPAASRRRKIPGKVLSAMALLVLALGAAAIWWVWLKPGPPALWSFDQNMLFVSDAQSRELWRSSFANTLSSGYYKELTPGKSPLPWFGDIDQDGDIELLFEEKAADPGTHADALTCFSAVGKVKWRWVPGRPVATKEKSYRSNFGIMGFLVARMGPGRPYSILVSSSHYPNHICQIALLSAGGKLQREYWHSGHIGAAYAMQLADRNHDGRSEIYLGGVNNGSSNQATLVVLDPDSFEGASLEEAPEHQWIDMPPGRELARLLFPRSCINTAEERYNFVCGLSWDNDLLMVHVHETRLPESSIMYQLDAALNPVSVTIGDTFRAKHQQMELDKKLDHRLDEQEIAAFYRLRYLTSPHFN